MAMSDASAMQFEQVAVTTHSNWQAAQNRAVAGDTNIAEQTRIAYLIDRANLALAGDILAQRSSQSQPQQTGSVINPGSVTVPPGFKLVPA